MQLTMSQQIASICKCRMANGARMLPPGRVMCLGNVSPQSRSCHEGLAALFTDVLESRVLPVTEQTVPVEVDLTIEAATANVAEKWFKSAV